MEITGVETYTMQVPLDQPIGDSRASVAERYWVVVELETDEGLTGTGWLGTWRAAATFQHYLEETFFDLLVGRNPFETEVLREEMRERTLYYPGELGMSAHPRAAIDVALWDLKAQAAGEPLYRFLGGDNREVRAYCSRMDADYNRDELAALHAPYADDGFTAFKTKVGGDSIEEDAERVRAVRDAVGPDADLFVDANQAWSVAEAIRAADAFSESDVGWIEEPVSEFDESGIRRVGERVSPALAGGEMFYRPERFRRLLETGGMAVAQPDLIRIGGISGILDVATLSHRHGVPLAPHIYYPVAAHVVSAVPNGQLVEYIPEYDVSGIVENSPEIREGHVVLPTEPGHGYRISPETRDTYEVPVSHPNVE